MQKNVKMLSTSFLLLWNYICIEKGLSKITDFRQATERLFLHIMEKVLHRIQWCTWTLLTIHFMKMKEASTMIITWKQCWVMHLGMKMIPLWLDVMCKQKHFIICWNQRNNFYMKGVLLIASFLLQWGCWISNLSTIYQIDASTMLFILCKRQLQLQIEFHRT